MGRLGGYDDGLAVNAGNVPVDVVAAVFWLNFDRNCEFASVFVGPVWNVYVISMVLLM